MILLHYQSYGDANDSGWIVAEDSVEAWLWTIHVSLPGFQYWVANRIAELIYGGLVGQLHRLYDSGVQATLIIASGVLPFMQFDSFRSHLGKTFHVYSYQVYYMYWSSI